VATPIERDGDPEAIERLNAVVKPFLLRRKKTDPGIAPELPPKIERDVIVPLTPEQITLYQATTKEVLAELAQNDGIARHGLILKLLTALKQITNHPAQYLGETAPLAGRSGKLAALDDLMASTLSQDQSTLIFSQYVTMGNLIKDHLRSQGIEIDMLHGGLSIKKRQELVDRFQAGKLPVLILSLKAGGTGLNLTRATNVVHYDRWWNPAVEDQATDRAYRIGQDQTVTVHRLVTEGTVEDRVRELLTQKRALADSVIGSGEQWIGNLSDDALAELVQLSTSATGPDVSDDPLNVGSHDESHDEVMS
jgi:SNF2 family DNA or RNA helicase